MPAGVNLMALTATATRTLRSAVIKTLGMRNPVVISRSPHKPNIYLSLAMFESIEKSLTPLAQELLDDGVCTDRTIICCKRLNDCADIFAFFRSYLGPQFLVSPTSPDHTRYRLVDMYTSCNKPHVKQEILDAFTTPHSSLRVITATIAFWLRSRLSRR